MFQIKFMVPQLSLLLFVVFSFFTSEKITFYTIRAFVEFPLLYSLKEPYLPHMLDERKLIR